MSLSSDWLLFCEADRTQLLSLCGCPTALPADTLDTVIEELLGFSLVTRPLAGRVLGQCNYDRSCISINSRMPDLVLPNTDLQGLTHSTKAHELAHIRLPHHEAEVRAAHLQGMPLPPEVACRHEEEANSYASLYLVPTVDLWAMPSVTGLLATQAHSTVMSSDALWMVVVELARAFRVTGSLMARRLEHLGLVEMAPDRQLRLAPAVAPGARVLPASACDDTDAPTAA